MKRVLFRADSSSKIGTGHIMRDLVLAKRFKQQGIVPMFACLNLEGNIMSKIPYDVITLQTDTKEELIQYIRKFEINLLVIDHYGIDYEYEKYIKEQTGVKIFVFDATYKRHYCDYLLNQNIYAEKKNYKSLVPASCKVFCGLAYALVRDEFMEARSYMSTKLKPTESPKKRLLITLGGSDPHNDTLRILKILEGVQTCLEITVVLGRANSHISAIRVFAQTSKHTIIIKQDVIKMVNVMRGIDCAIVSAGTTAIELLYMKLPFFVIAIAKNQELVYRYLVENHLAYDFSTFAEERLIDCQLNQVLEIGTKDIVSEVVV